LSRQGRPVLVPGPCRADAGVLQTGRREVSPCHLSRSRSRPSLSVCFRYSFQSEGAEGGFGGVPWIWGGDRGPASLS